MRPFSSSTTRRSGRSSSSGARFARARYIARQHAQSGRKASITSLSISGMEQGEDETWTRASSASIAACASS